MRRTIAIIFLSVLASTACNRGRGSAAPRAEFTTDEYSVLSGYIAGAFSNEEVKKDKLELVFFNTTQSGDDDLLHDENGRPVPWEKTSAFLRTKAPALQLTTIDSFRRANSEQAVLVRSLAAPIDYELVDSGQLDTIFKNNGGSWSAYYKQYPHSNGIVTWSRVGFSADGTQALFYFSNRCGGLCGGGRYVVMQKRNGRWATETEIEMWVS